MTKQIFLPSDGPTGTPSLRTLGTGAQQALAGNDGRLSDARTPTSHASTHDVGGSDVLKDLTRLAAGPAIHNMIASAGDTPLAITGSTPVAGVVYLVKVLTAHAYTITNLTVVLNQGGSGVTALANVFLGVYDSGGTRRGLTADQSSPFASSGNKTVALGTPYVVTVSDFVYVAFLVGTQATTPLKFLTFQTGQANLYSVGLTAATQRFTSQLTGQTSLPSSLTLSSNGGSINPFWVGIS